MSSDETPKIEPTLIVKDAPSIAAIDQPAAPEAAKPEIEAAKPEIKVEAKAEAPEFEVAAPKPRRSNPQRPSRKGRSAEVRIVDQPGAEPAAGPADRSGRRCLQAEARARERAPPRRRPAPPASRCSPPASPIAASFGAVGGSLGVAKFGPMIASAPAPVAAVAKEHVADEVKALKDTVAQLRATTKSLSDNLAALKTTVTTASCRRTARSPRRSSASRRPRPSSARPWPRHRPHRPGSHRLDRAEASRSAAVPMVLGDPPTTLKPPIVPGFVLRRVYDGAALIEGRDGIIEVEPGMVAPGLGRIEAIKRQDGRWVVVTARGHRPLATIAARNTYAVAGVPQRHTC